jgi:fluoroquinolone transport system permease protein
MKRLAATIAQDFRLQYRNGFYLATVLVLIVSVALVRALPQELAALVLPSVIIGNVLINTFYFASALLLLERIEGTIVAQAVTPLRPRDYLTAKVATLTVLCLFECLILGAATFGVQPGLIRMAIGIVLAAVLFCLVGIALVTRYDSINEFLLPSILYSFALTVPLAAVFGIGSPNWFWPHPLQGILLLMRIEQPLTAASLVVTVMYPLVCIAPAYVWSRRALETVRAS